MTSLLILLAAINAFGALFFFAAARSSQTAEEGKLNAPSSASFPRLGGAAVKRGNSFALLKRGYFTQALIDSTAVLFCFLFILMTAASLPLAVFLLFFCSF